MAVPEEKEGEGRPFEVLQHVVLCVIVAHVNYNLEVFIIEILQVVQIRTSSVCKDRQGQIILEFLYLVLSESWYQTRETFLDIGLKRRI